MHEAHFHLRRNPFGSASRSDFIYPSQEIEEICAHFRYAQEMGEAFFLLTGEVGTGKTTAIRAILEKTPPDVPTAVISHNTVKPRELLEEMGVCFGLDPVSREPKPKLVRRLQTFLAINGSESRRPVVFFDEAHLLTDSVLEEVRLLSNLEEDGRPLILICLVGQPELVTRLRRPRLRQLRQRIGLRYELKPLTRGETTEYLSYRLKAAGSIKPGRVFSKEAGDTIYEFTGGFPREINILAGQAMLNAYLEDKHAVSPTHVILAKTDYGFEGVHARTPTRTRRSHKSH